MKKPITGRGDRRRRPLWDRRASTEAEASELALRAAQLDCAVDRALGRSELSPAAEAERDLRRRDLSLWRKAEITAELVMAFRAGDVAAGDTLVARFSPLIGVVAWRFRSRLISQTELKEMGRAALGEAVATDPRAIQPSRVLLVLKAAVYNGVRAGVRSERRWARRHVPLADLPVGMNESSEQLSEERVAELLMATGPKAGAPRRARDGEALDLLEDLTVDERALIVATQQRDECVSVYVVRTRPDLLEPALGTEIKRLRTLLQELLVRLRRSSRIGRGRE